MYDVPFGNTPGFVGVMSDMLFDRVNVRETTAALFADTESFGQFYVGLPAPPPPGNLPVVDAGDDQLVSFGDTVILDGSASFDPDGGSLNFSWDVDGADLNETCAGSPVAASSRIFRPVNSLAVRLP